MAKDVKWEVSSAEEKRLIDALTRELILLRAKLGISQAELSRIVGISRQTYSAVENGSREMSWNTYLSLICFFDNHADTQQLLRQSAAYPKALFSRINDGRSPDDARITAIAGIPQSITEKLDAQAFHAIRTVVMLEYARCTKLPGETVIKAFDGVNLTPVNPAQEKELMDALSQIRTQTHGST